MNLKYTVAVVSIIGGLLVLLMHGMRIGQPVIGYIDSIRSTTELLKVGIADKSPNAFAFGLFGLPVGILGFIAFLGAAGLLIGSVMIFVNDGVGMDIVFWSGVPLIVGPVYSALYGAVLVTVEYFRADPRPAFVDLLLIYGVGVWELFCLLFVPALSMYGIHETYQHETS
jgi:hypothetical protein